MAKDLFGFTCNLFAAHQLNKFCNSALQLTSSAFGEISLNTKHASSANSRGLQLVALRAECTNVDNRRIKLIHGLTEDLLEFGIHQARLSSTAD